MCDGSFENVQGSFENVQNSFENVQGSLGMCRALLRMCRTLCRTCRALLRMCRALLRLCRALLSMCRALLSMCRALFENAQHTYAQVGLSAGEAAGVVLGKCRRFYCVYGDTGLCCSVFPIYIPLFCKSLSTYVCVAGQISSVYLRLLRYRILLECIPHQYRAFWYISLHA